jgi:hypothetical protein
MIGLAFLAAAIAVVVGYSRALDARDERRRREQLARWYDEHGGGNVVDD